MSRSRGVDVRASWRTTTISSQPAMKIRAASVAYADPRTPMRRRAQWP